MGESVLVTGASTGLGREMARCALTEGLRHGWRKITVDVPATHQSTINMFSGR